MSEAMQLRQLLGDTEDGRLLADTLEGETNIFEVIDALAERLLADRALAELGRARSRRIEARADKLHEVIERMLTRLGLTEPLERALYTASLSYTRPVQVTNESELPEAFIARRPDKLAIGLALRRGETVPGAVLGNDLPHLTLRTK